MFFRILFILRVNKNVIKENKNKPIQLPAENIFHEAHECSWYICETKWYHYKIIVYIPCYEGCIMNIVILDSYLMVTGPQVNLGKHLCSSHLIKKVINSR